jgi:hypothetical protein
MSALSRLRRLGNEWQKRPQIIAEARTENATWQEIADALHMTPHGVRKLHATGVRPEIMWVEHGGDDVWYLRAAATSEHPDGEVRELHRFVDLHDDGSIAEIGEIAKSWGWILDGVLWVDQLGRYQVPVAPAGR